MYLKLSFFTIINVTKQFIYPQKQGPKRDVAVWDQDVNQTFHFKSETETETDTLRNFLKTEMRPRPLISGPRLRPRRDAQDPDRNTCDTLHTSDLYVFRLRQPWPAQFTHLLLFFSSLQGRHKSWWPDQELTHHNF